LSALHFSMYFLVNLKIKIVQFLKFLINALTQRRAGVKMAEQAELIGSKDTRLAGQRSSSMSACNVC
jgi:hypothetical protein